jgi:hypothetical protein
MVAASLIGTQEALYGPRPLPAGLQTPVQDDPEPIDVSAMAEEPETPAAAAPIDPAVAGQQEIPFEQEPEMPPEEAAAPLCGLPITEAMLAAADPTRVAHIDAIAKWIKHAHKVMPPDAVDALCLKLGTGFDPLTASVADLAGVIGALKAEIGKVTK